MKIEHVILVSAVLGIVGSGAACASDLIELPPTTNQLLSFSLLPIESQNGSNALGLQVISLSLAEPAATRTTSWFLRPAGPLSSAGIEQAERINAQAIRRQREAWERAQKTRSLAPVQPHTRPRSGRLSTARND